LNRSIFSLSAAAQQAGLEQAEAGCRRILTPFSPADRKKLCLAVGFDMVSKVEEGIVNAKANPIGSLAAVAMTMGHRLLCIVAEKLNEEEGTAKPEGGAQ